MKRKEFFKNIIVGFGGQLILMVLGIIIPRIMIVSYGSDVNGLLSTITQIFTYLVLLEAGIGQAAKNTLYKYLVSNDKDSVSRIVIVAKKYYAKITIYYGLAVICLATIAPFVLKSNVDKITIFLIIILEGLSGVISFYFIETDIALLNADGKGYINNSINVLNRIIGYIVKIFMAYFKLSIVTLQLAYFLITILKVIVYRIYINKQYPWLRSDINTENEVLKDRNAFVLTEIAWTIFSSTDMIVLSMFMSTTASSVYAVYNIVFSNINNIFSTVFHSISYVLGKLYHESIQKYIKIHDSFNSIFIGGMTILLCVTYLLIIPFIRLYTKGVTDVDYINASLPLLFCLVQLFSWTRYVTGQLSSIAGYAKPVSRISIIEAITNLILSVLLVNIYGITGVVAATVGALPVKVIYLTWLSDKVILKRSFKKTLKIIFVNYLLFFSTVYFSRFLPINIKSFIQFTIYGVIFTLIYTVIGVVLNLLVNKDCAKYCKTILKGN